MTKAAKRKAVKIIVVINQKGGVGKTAISFHLAKLAAESGQQVLVIDTDTQGNLSQFLTGDLEIQEQADGGAGVLFETGSFDHAALVETQFENIHLLHGHIGLDSFDNQPAIEDRVYSPEFRRMMHELPFDVVVIDTPPAVGIRHIAPLIWADLAVIPMEPAMSSVAGFQSVLRAIEYAQGMNPALQWLGVLNRFSKAAASHRQIEEFVRKTYGRKIAPTLSARTAVADGLQENPAVPVWRMPSAKRDLRELWRSFCAGVIG